MIGGEVGKQPYWMALLLLVVVPGLDTLNPLSHSGWQVLVIRSSGSRFNWKMSNLSLQKCVNISRALSIRNRT